MSTEQPDPLAFASYELGELSTKLLFYAEMNWCAVPEIISSQDQDTHEWVEAFKTLNWVCAQIQSIATQLSNKPEQRSANAELKTALENFLRVLEDAWNGDERTTASKKAQRKCDPEFAVDRDIRLVQISPLGAIWPAVTVAIDGFVRSLDRAYQWCFQLSALLASEIYPTITGGQRTRDPETERAYLVVEFGGKLRSAIAATSLKFPSLESIPWDLDISGEINRLHGDFGRILQGPEQASPYLGVVLNRRLGQVGRYRKIVKLKDPVLWELLICVVRNGVEFSSRETLDSACRRAGLANPTPHAVDGLIGDLRDVLRPLHVEIENRRDRGVRLIDLSQAPASQAPPSATPSPGIHGGNPPKQQVDSVAALIGAEHAQFASGDSTDDKINDVWLTPFQQAKAIGINETDNVKRGQKLYTVRKAALKYGVLETTDIRRMEGHRDYVKAISWTRVVELKNCMVRALGSSKDALATFKRSLRAAAGSALCECGDIHRFTIGQIVICPKNEKNRMHLIRIDK